MRVRLSMLTLTTAAAVALGASGAQARIVDKQGGVKVAKPVAISAQAAARGILLRYQTAKHYFPI
jgi:hypothetical protein